LLDSIDLRLMRRLDIVFANRNDRCCVSDRAHRVRKIGFAAYGAPAKGNTLLNYRGIGRDFISFTVDRNVHKKGLLLPGTGIPVLAPNEIASRWLSL